MHIVAYLLRWVAPAPGAGVLCLAVPTGRAQVVISEFMASNTTGLQDEDGACSNWLELHNAGVAPVDLNSWHLTASATKLVQRTFPATTLGAYEGLLAPGGSVFCRIELEEGLGAAPASHVEEP